MDAEELARHELGAFLRRKRAAANRAEYGLPPVGRSRVSGLRREEIAFLSGVSVTWYTWLEQGRSIRPSRQVLDAVAVGLRLTQAEHDYVLGIAGFAPLPAAGSAAPDEVPAHVQHLLDAVDPAPAFALNGRWDICAWNSSYERLFPAVSAAPGEERNLLSFVFTHPAVRAMLPDWEVTSRRFLAEYRAETGTRAGGPEHVRLIARLRQESEDFARAWDDHEVVRFASRRRSFLHPADGEVSYEQIALAPQDAPELRIIAYLPARS